MTGPGPDGWADRMPSPPPPYPGQFPAPYQAPPPPPPKRPFPVLAMVAVVVVALGVGIPVALLVGSGGSKASGSTTTTARTTQAPPPPVTSSPTYAPPPTSSPPDTGQSSGGPGNLSSAEDDLWTSLGMQGVDSESCLSYPQGEQVTADVEASIQCTVDDSSFTEPIIYYQFPDQSGVNEYMNMRAAEVDRTGACASGFESVGSWTHDSTTQGQLICVDNTKDGTTFFKMVWSSTSTHQVAVVQGESYSDTYQWWYENGGQQFGS